MFTTGSASDSSVLDASLECACGVPGWQGSCNCGDSAGARIPSRPPVLAAAGACASRGYHHPMPRILLVDEDRAFAAALGRALAEEGWSLQWVSTPRAMLCELAGRDHDAIVLDPGVSGCLWYGLLEDLRQAARTAGIHVVTAHASSALSRQAANVRASSFLVKPTPVASLVAALVRGERRWVTLRFPPSLAAIEWEALNEALYQHRGNATLAARSLRIPRQTLYRKLRKYAPLQGADDDAVTQPGAGESGSASSRPGGWCR